MLGWHLGRGGLVPTVRVFPADKPAIDLVVLDVDRDGRLDVFAQSWDAGAIVYFGDGRGGFPRQVAVETLVDGYNDLKSGDLNGDGYDDVAVLSGQGITHAYVYYNDGTDNLSWPLEVVPNPAEGTILGSLAIGDSRSDGLDDLVVARSRTSLSLFDQRGDGTLSAARVVATDFDPEAMVMADMDDDGRQDLVIQHGSGDVGIHFNGASGLGTEVRYPAPYATHYNTQGLAVGDINGDGCKDVAVANYIYGLVVHLGQGCQATADVTPALSLSPTSILVDVANRGSAAAADVVARIDLSVQSGSLQLPAVPAGCSAVTSTARMTSLVCRADAVAAGAHSTVRVPISAVGGGVRNRLIASVSVVTATRESTKANNAARKQVMLSSRLSSPQVAGAARVGHSLRGTVVKSVDAP